MTYLLTFLVSVAANLASDIMSRFICKWLVRYDVDRKPYYMKSTLGGSDYEGVFPFWGDNFDL